jgi:hypothetical protein
MEGGAVGHNFKKACMTGFFINFERLPILTDYAN